MQGLGPQLSWNSAYCLSVGTQVWILSALVQNQIWQFMPVTLALWKYGKLTPELMSIQLT